MLPALSVVPPDKICQTDDQCPQVQFPALIGHADNNFIGRCGGAQRDLSTAGGEFQRVVDQIIERHAQLPDVADNVYVRLRHRHGKRIAGQFGCDSVCFGRFSQQIDDIDITAFDINARLNAAEIEQCCDQTVHPIDAFVDEIGKFGLFFIERAGFVEHIDISAHIDEWVAQIVGDVGHKIRFKSVD